MRNQKMFFLSSGNKVIKAESTHRLIISKQTHLPLSTLLSTLFFFSDKSQYLPLKSWVMNGIFYLYI